MVNSIVQHRRGHIDSWRRSVIVPLEGELIIVEFDDGSRRCKIGDGINRFSALSYVDDATKNELLEKLSAAEKTTDTRIRNATTYYTNQLTLAKEEIAQQVIPLESTVKKLTASLASIDAALEQRLQQSEQVNSDSISALRRQLDNFRSELSVFSEQNELSVAQLAKFNETLRKAELEILDLVEDDCVITDKLYAVENEIAAELKQLRASNINVEKRIQKNFDTLANAIESSKLYAETLSEDAIDKLNKFKRESNEQTQDIYGKLAEAHSRMTVAETKVETQRKRIDEFVALKDGSTTGDAELLDARIDYYGTRHDSAGEHIRSVGGAIQALTNSLSQYIDTEAIDGLHYDQAGEVGQNVPYMLYLTAGGNVIQDSGVQIISGAGGGGGGGSSLKIGYITTSPLIITAGDKAELRFTFSGTDSSGDDILQATATWRVNGAIVAHSVVRAGENAFDVTKYITTGTTKVLLTVADDGGHIVTKTWNVQQVELSLESRFDDKRKYTANKPVIFDYIPNGAVEKTAVFILNGHEIDRVQLGKEVSGSTVSYELPAMAHGTYLLDIYLEAAINDGDAVQSNHIYKDIIYYDDTVTSPVIGVVPQELTVKQYSSTNIVYTVYDPSTDTPVVDILIDDILVESITVSSNKDYENTTTSVYSYIAATSGNHTIKLKCGSTEKVIKVYVEAIGITIAPVTTGLVFDFNPATLSNESADRLWSSNGIHLSVSDNFDWTNGGYIKNDPDGQCFCIKAGSSATIDYKLFEDEAKVSGKELKLVFKTRNVSNPEATFLSCVDNTTNKDHVGIVMGVHEASIYGKNGKLELAYSEEDAVEFEFNISRSTEAVPMVMGYEDGVPSRPMVYDSTCSFKQNTPQVITLGSPDCDLYIYRFKVYNRSLSTSEILKNFIADARTADEMLARHNRNQIYDENQKLTAEVLADKCPWLRVYKISAPHFTNNKSDKVSDTTIQQIYRGGDPILDNWIAHNAQHSGQGTSSNNYGAAGRNLDFIMNKSNSYFELGDGTTQDDNGNPIKEITLSRTSVPVAYLNAKVNIASSNNVTNAVLANRFNRYNPYRRPFVRIAELSDAYSSEEIELMSEEERATALAALQVKVDSELSYIKDTMEFYNCAIFIQETDPDLASHREFADTNWHFYAIGNIGDSKKTDKTRLTDKNDPYECCVEIMDVDLPLSAFPRDTMINAMSYSVDEKTGEHKYLWAKDANLGILFEKQADGSYVLTSDTTVDLNKTYYVDILEHDDFSEDFTYGWRYISDDENPEIVATCKQAWIDFYRFVTTSSDEEFRANLSRYFVVDSAIYDYLFTTRYCMVDNRAKNTFWHYSKTGEVDADGNPIRKWDLNWNYDNDTALGLNNYGKQVYRYGLEDIDYDEAGTEVFRQSNSLFFCRIRDLFKDRQKTMYQELESRGAWSASDLIQECDAWQEQFPEELWRLDIDRKYIRTYNSSFINGSGDKQFLNNMANGRMKYHRRQWERNQEQYMASKYQTTAAMGDAAHANFRVNRFDSTDDLVIKPNYQFTLTPYSYMYLNVKYSDSANVAPVSVRAVPNVPTIVPYVGDSADIINVGSAASITDFGDLSALYPQTVSIQNATRVKKAKIGNNTDGYVNNGFTSLTTGSNGLLEELDITNIASYNATLDLSALINLKKVYAFGTNIPGVIFAQGGKIDSVELPSMNSLELMRLAYLENANLNLASYDNIVDLTVQECPLIDQLALFELCPNLSTAKLDNINFGTKTYQYFEDKVLKLSSAAITGTVHIESLTGQQFNNLRNRYPKLTVTYDSLDSIIKIMDTDLETTKYEQHVMNAGDCTDPTTVAGWVSHAMPATQEFTYEWFGWSESKNIVLNYEALSGQAAAEAEQADYVHYRVNSLKHVEGDRILYPVFKAIRNSYEVQFKNPTDNNRTLYTVMVPYGKNAAYAGEPPRKLDSVSPDIYEFTGWHPAPENITGPLTSYAQFAVMDSIWYTIGMNDIPEYSTDTAVKTISIIDCDNDLNAAMRVPATITVSGADYTVVSLGGFDGHSLLELMQLPDSLKIIQNSAFKDCSSLFEINLPAGLVKIGSDAFRNCTKLADIHLPASLTNIGDKAFVNCPSLETLSVAEDNPVYKLLDGCVVDTRNNTLLFGIANAKIPQDGTVIELSPYCFAYTNLIAAHVPEGITTIPANAFSWCKQLATVTLPSTLTTLDATCFGWCSNLTSIDLPESLTDIKTYIFHGTSLENVVIPAAVNNIMDNAFGSDSKLKTVTFKPKYNASGNIVAPKMHRNAFAESGAGTLVFNVPWSADYDHGDDESNAAAASGWGAKNFTINYNYQEVD